MSPGSGDSLDISTLAAGYAQGKWTIAVVVEEVLRRVAEYPDPAVWIDRLGKTEIDAQIAKADGAKSSGKNLPLYGIPFAVKDNIDVAGRPTTAGCPAFAYVPKKSATIVQKLCDAGAILVGKTNLDQFATGLVGVRSPYGACKNPFDGQYISGGSSSGSAVAVAAGLVSFALGTDTAGSGRVPAGFNNIVGLKPTRGLFCCAGVVPACQSLDCVSVFSLTCDDAAMVASVLRGYDPADPYSRKIANLPAAMLPVEGLRFGIPREDQLQFFGNIEYARIYRATVERMIANGGKRVEIDFEPFSRAAALLYSGPWVAERMSGLREFFRDHREAFLPVIAEILSGAAKFDAADVFTGLHQLAELQQLTGKQWENFDVMLLPTAPTIYTREEVEAQPILLNTNLGYYTNFVNLLDLCAVAAPAGFTSGGLPCGATLIAPAGQDENLLRIADALHRSMGLTIGNTDQKMPPAKKLETQYNGILLAVVGAHLSGQPLNGQLTSRNAKLVRSCRSDACYRLYALPNTSPPKPGLVRVTERLERGIELEVWELTPEAFGTFVAEVPPPMVIGTVRLEDGSEVKGFSCETFALQGAEDISHFGGWRAYRKSRS